MLVIATHLAIGGLLLAAAVTDLRSFRIPNAIPLALSVLFGATAFLGVHGAILPHLMSFAIAGAVGGVLYALHVWGGGDTKLAAALALFMVPMDLSRFLFVTTVAGGAVAVVFLVNRRVATGPELSSNRIPYGIALATGGLDWCLFH